MNQEQIAKLKELAKAATPGPWRHDGIEYGDMGHRYQTVTEQNDGDYVVGEYGIQEHDAAFISAANPSAILELIALAERALLAAAPAPIQQEPVLWIESEPSARLLPLDEIINGMCFTVLYHHKKPQTDNPVWPLYAGAALAGSQVQAAGDAVDAAMFRWLCQRDVTVEGIGFVCYAPELSHDGSNLRLQVEEAMREQQT